MIACFFVDDEDRYRGDAMSRFRVFAAERPLDTMFDCTVTEHRDGVDILTDMLSSRWAGRIHTLRWVHHRKHALTVTPRLANCRELHTLKLGLNESALFAARALESCPKITTLKLSLKTNDGSEELFEALGRSRVLKLTLKSFSPELGVGFAPYLAKNRLTCLKVYVYWLSLEIMEALAKCTLLVELKLSGCVLHQGLVLPKSVIALTLTSVKVRIRDLRGCAEWSLPGVRELYVNYCSACVEWGAMGRALTALKVLMLYDVYNVHELLDPLDLSQLNQLAMYTCGLREGTVAQITSSLTTGFMRELTMPYGWCNSRDSERGLLQAIKHSMLNKLSLSNSPFAPHRYSTEDKFHHQIEVLTVLQGQQVRRLRGPLRRLPVEMFRLVGGMLI